MGKNEPSLCHITHENFWLKQPKNMVLKYYAVDQNDNSKKVTNARKTET